MATSSTSVKKDAATEKYVAEPPRQRSAFPNGVSMLSNATLPTTRMLIRSPFSVLRCWSHGQRTTDNERLLHIFADDWRKSLFRFLRNHRWIGDDGVLQRIDARAVALARGDPRHRSSQN